MTPSRSDWNLALGGGGSSRLAKDHDSHQEIPADTSKLPAPWRHQQQQHQHQQHQQGAEVVYAADAAGFGFGRRQARTIEAALAQRNAKRSISMQQACGCVCSRIPVILAMFGVAFGFGIPAAIKVNLRIGALQAWCRLSTFHYPADYIFLAGDNMPCPEGQGLDVTASITRLGLDPILVLDWEPAFDANLLEESRGWGNYEEFKCCQLHPFDICQFYRDGRFCDNFGDYLPSCPSAPWECFIADWTKHAASASDGVPGTDLYLGRIDEGIIELVISSIIGILALVWTVCPFIVSKSVATISKHCGHRMWVCSHVLPVALAKLLPDFFLPRALEEALRKDLAIRSIQRWWRKVYFHRGVLRFLMASRKELVEASADRLRNAAIVAAMKKSRLAHIPPPHPRPPMPRSLLYDTGNPCNFSRTVKSRVVVEPGPGRKAGVRIEVALSISQKLGADLEDLGAGHPPAICSVDRRSLAGVCGLQVNDRLVKVGALLWPEADAKALMAALASGPRPLFCVFKGPLRPWEVVKRTQEKVVSPTWLMCSPSSNISSPSGGSGGTSGGPPFAPPNVPPMRHRPSTPTSRPAPLELDVEVGQEGRPVDQDNQQHQEGKTAGQQRRPQPLPGQLEADLSGGNLERQWRQRPRSTCRSASGRHGSGSPVQLT